MEDWLVPDTNPYKPVFKHNMLVGMKMEAKRLDRKHALEMMDALGTADQALTWLEIDWLASLPNTYMDIVNRGQKLFEWSDKTVKNMRDLGRRCPPERRRTDLCTITHHRVIFLEYNMTKEQQDYWLERLEASKHEVASRGYIWSTEKLRQEIRAELGLPTQNRFDDHLHETERENALLKREAWQATGKVAVMQMFVRDHLLPAIEGDADFEMIARTLEGFIEQEEDISFPETPWHAHQVEGGGYEFYTVRPDGAHVFSYEEGHEPGVWKFLRDTRLVKFEDNADNGD